MLSVYLINAHHILYLNNNNHHGNNITYQSVYCIVEKCGKGNHPWFTLSTFKGWIHSFFLSNIHKRKPSHYTVMNMCNHWGTQVSWISLQICVLNKNFLFLKRSSWIGLNNVELTSPILLVIGWSSMKVPQQWHIFITLIVSCTDTTIASGNHCFW